MLPGDFPSIIPTKPDRKDMVRFGVLGITGLAGLALVVIILLFVISAWLGRPISMFGYDEGPDQPIVFPHTTHVQEVGLDCSFCDRNVTKGASATVPSVGLSMTCHTVVGDESAEIEKLRDYHSQGEPIDWVRVHRLPDHVRFNHQAHIQYFSEKNNILPAAVCATCHGDVGNMKKVRQVEPLKMGNCVDCHRDNNAPTDCSTCHY